MRIVDLLSPSRIALHGTAADKASAIDLLVDLQDKGGALKDKAAYKQAILARESQTSTAIEAGIAVPHAKSDAVIRPSLAAMALDTGVDYGAMDGAPSDLFFMIAAPMDGDLHLEILSHLMVLLMEPAFTAELRAAADPESFLAVIDKYERAKYGEPEEAEKPAEPAAVPAKKGFRVLAVTACPTGIAHTYMAAEALEKAGEKLGIPLKAETDGSGGAKNVLTPAEIEAADGIIVAADRNVETARFSGKKVLFVSVSDGIHKPEELIQRIESGNVPVYQHAGGSEEAVDAGKSESVGRKIYKHLMNGVSHMLPFVIGGGILIALAFLLDDASIKPENFGMNTPVAAFFKTVGTAAFNFMLPILAGYIAYSIADRPGLVVGFVGGYLASTGTSFWTITGSAEAIPAGFLGALLAGFVGGYFMLLLRKGCDKFPRSLEGIKPILVYPVLGVLFMGAFMCLINPIMGLINTGLVSFLGSLGGSSRILLGAVLGAMMSIDMGGPFNKAAYVTGTAAIVEAAAAGAASDDIRYMMMASVMIGGMVPPLAIALASTIFRRKFTPDERKSGVVNYIMGACFITEGAIPFAASDPLRVIPSCAIGSAVAGALSMVFGCALPAPHGGIFVFPLVHNVLGYILALVIGSVVGMLLLGLLRKNRVPKAA